MFEVYVGIVCELRVDVSFCFFYIVLLKKRLKTFSAPAHEDHREDLSCTDLFFSLLQDSQQNDSSDEDAGDWARKSADKVSSCPRSVLVLDQLDQHDVDEQEGEPA